MGLQKSQAVQYHGYNDPPDSELSGIKRNVEVAEYLNNPHQAVEIEDALIGGILLDSRTITEVFQIVCEDSFYDNCNRVIFKAITELWQRGDKIDMVIISQYLREKGLLNQIGGVVHLAKLTQKVGSCSHAESHARIVQQKYIARKYVELGMRIVSEAIDAYVDVADVIDRCNTFIDEVNTVCAGKSSARHIGVIANDALKEAEARQARRANGQTIGISTGIMSLDKILGGFQPLLYILAARPSMGKTAVMIHFAKMAAMAGRNVCIYSLEMSDISLTNRFLLSLSEVNADNFRSGNLTSAEWQQLEQARSELNRMNIYIDPNSSVTMNYVAAHSQLMKNQNKCDMILLDYLQFIDSTSKRFGNRNDEVGKMSKRAKQLSKNLNIPFIMLSQLSRDCEKRTDKHPLLSDLRDSGNIEQDADVIMFLYRAAYYGQSEVETRSFGAVSSDGLMELIVAKQRDGATGGIPISHNSSMTRFSDYNGSPPRVGAVKGGVEDDVPSFHRGVEDDVPSFHRGVEDDVPSFHRGIEDDVPSFHQGIEDDVPF